MTEAYIEIPILKPRSLLKTQEWGGIPTLVPIPDNPQELDAKKGQIQVETLLLENHPLKQEVELLRGEIQGLKGVVKN